jgi:hypothetical protein
MFGDELERPAATTIRVGLKTALRLGADIATPQMAKRTAINPGNPKSEFRD